MRRMSLHSLLFVAACGILIPIREIRLIRCFFTFCFLLFCFSFLTSHAQCPTENTAFKAGESLTYDLYFHWKFIWVKCGAAHYTMRSATYKGQPALRNDLLFTSNKRCDAVFTMRDTLISYITPQLVPLYFRKGSLEGKNYTVDEVWYTYPNGKSHVKQRYLSRHGDVHLTHHESDDCNYDMLSILSLARNWSIASTEKKPSERTPSPLRGKAGEKVSSSLQGKVGERVFFPMATGKKVEKQTLVYRGKKDWKANDGKKYHCLVFSLLDYEDTQKDKELLRFYVTDDPHHLPVRIDFYLRFGTAKAYLAKSSGISN